MACLGLHRPAEESEGHLSRSERARAESKTGATRREVLRAGASLVAGYGLAPPAWARVCREVQQDQWTPRYFSALELETFRILADLIIPRDARSGSATEAGVVEYADFVLSESNDRTKQVWRDGFAWLDAECWQRFGTRRFASCTQEQRTEVLDDIAWPRRAGPEFREAVAWFNRVRDLVGAGFFSSQVGVEDIGYIGGVFNPVWRGAPPEALRDLGVSYDEWDRRYVGTGTRESE